MRAVKDHLATPSNGRWEESEKQKKGGLAIPDVLAQRAASEGPRWTRVRVETTWLPLQSQKGEVKGDADSAEST
jgi:hypothetical protein